MGKPVKKNEGPDPISVASKTARYIRMMEHPLKPGDHYVGYQAELVLVDGDMVVKKVIIDKPNTFENAWAKALDYIDPRNESLPDA